MTPIDQLRDADCIAEVISSEIPGVDFIIVAEERVRKDDLRVLWLQKYREAFEWVGESEHHAERTFALLSEKDQ